MAGDRRYSSVFDELLDDNRRQLDSLLGSSPNTNRTSRVEPERSRSAVTTAVGSARLDGERLDDWSDSPVAATLDDRFGRAWRFEIRERRHEHDEVIVLGRLTVADRGLSRSQFGHAKIGATAGVDGASGGVAFSLGGTAQDEQATARRAALDALANCAKLV
ncbi:MAG: hypothetical protein HOI95_25480 [Chromatiales bacterium]|jgi:hypothetical protein|nr:hypothetical protein [Chromatiales bacterium]